MIQYIVNKPCDYSFFQAVSLLEKHYQNLSGIEYKAIGENQYVKNEYIQFSVSPKLSFPKSDIEFITEFERNDATYTQIEVNFMGLHGVSSPLPASYTEKLAGRDPDDNPVKEFFDFFHHRYISMLYRVWKKYRYHIQYKSDAKDPFSGRLLHLVGLSSVIQESNEVDLDRAKLLSYVNQLSTRTRSPKLVSGIVSHYFSLSNVYIEEWVYRRITIAVSQRNCLNRKNCQLGGDFHLGQSMADLTGKFNLCIDDIDFDTYVKFLPGGALHETLIGLMKFILCDPMAWDLKLTVRNKSLPINQLGDGLGNELGQTFWLGTTKGEETKIKIVGSN
ncbi:type VI secretion protein [Aliivibrio fischeri]|uniref:type VI secretion system baseplate subunit TssG n=1 Tax=Aliivibrio fischeri TaxID=668 RepID=UPI00080E9EC1|nr:type VI secretion system baseplate subunit TssG [Aliivibrio fischeri]OCH27525.1 type VI secretion protein [Aliivibrio fischeri]